MKQYSGDVMNKIRTFIPQWFNAKQIAETDPKVIQSLGFSFFRDIYNPKTATGIGLDIWGRIVARSRFLKIEAEAENFGFSEGDANGDWYPFNDGVFYDKDGATNNVRLEDDVYRLLIMMKAFTNISKVTIPNLNNILMNIFSEKGKVYVIDLGDMKIRIVFDFVPTPWERAVIESDVIPHPAGVGIEYQYLNPENNFGFDGSGYQPFNTKPFYTESAREVEQNNA